MFPTEGLGMIIRRIALAFASVFLLLGGSGLLLAGAAQAAVAAPAVAPGDMVTVTPAVTQTSVTSHPISLQMAATDSTPGNALTFTWAATGLAAINSAISASGLITGNPTVQGTFPITVTATVATGTDAGLTGTATFNWVVTAGMATTPPGACTVTNPGSQSSVVNVAITPLQLHATDALAPGAVFTWTAVNLPTGLAISTSGLITGTPTVLGTVSTTVTATTTVPGAAAVSCSATFTWTKTVTPTPTVTVPGAAAPVMTVPAGAVGTGGGGSLGGPDAGLLAAGSATALAGLGLSALAVRRRVRKP